MQKKLTLLPFLLISFETAVYLSMDMYSPCLPFLANDFNVSQDHAQYTITSWFLGELCLMLFVGPISEKIGRKPVIVFGVGLFLFSSLICAVTSSFFLFLIARFLQGGTVAIPLVVGYAAIHESFDDKKAMQIMAVMGSITVLAPTLGPLFGAILIYISSWRNIFWLLTIWGGLSFLAICWKLTETCKETHPLNMNKIFHDYKNIISNRNFCKYAIPMAFSFMAIVIWIIGIPFVIIEYYKLSIIVLGVIQLSVFTFFIIGAQLTKKMLDTYDPKVVLRMGFNISFIGAVIFLVLVILFPSYLYLTTIGMMVLGLGMSMCFGPSNRLAIAACQEPMAYRTAIFTTISNLLIVVGTIIYSFLNSITMLNLAIAVFCGIALAFFSAVTLQKTPR